MPKLSSTLISDLTVRSARPAAARYEIRDAGLRGFMLRVSPNGAKSWYVQIDRNHKRKIGDAAVLTAAMARYRARDLLQRAALFACAAPGKRSLTLGDFLDGPYREWIGKRTRYGLRDTRRLRSALGALTGERLDQIGLSRLERWRLQRARQVSPGTLQRELSALKTALRRAVEWKYIPENPLLRMRARPTLVSRPVRILSETERKALLDRLGRRDDHLAILVLTALNTGLSRSELFRLRWKDVQLGTHASIEVSHTRKYRNRPRKIPLNPLAESTLERWRSSRRSRGFFVFPGPSGGRLKSIDTAWKRLMTETGIRNFRFSDCRHDFAARLVRSGVSLGRVRDLLGHSTISLTERYSSFARGSDRAAVNRLLPG